MKITPIKVVISTS